MLAALCAALVTTALLVVSPVRLCNPSYLPRNIVVRLVVPFNRLHLELLRAEPGRNTGDGDYDTGLLIMIQIISPFLSIGVAVSAWVAASFWLFALIVGNPDGTERGDDGKATVLAIRNWWARCLRGANG